MPQKDFSPTTYGKFFLTKFIAKGGMAEIFKAKSFGIGGFEKVCALKRILPQFCDDEKFLTMLSDEARLTVQLNHKNIIQVFDFGQMENQYYMSMELVEGVDLISLIDDLKEENQPLPIDIACYIAAQIAEGLDYAHHKKDNQGNPLNIIHRDISPHNVLLSFNGDVKISDFGIAKATSNLPHTQTGTIKGKVCYLSPEQLKAENLDGRSDLFACGLVLYEMLMGKRFFNGNSQVEVLGKISTTHITEDMLPSSIPEKLRKILLKSLEYDVNQRYTSCGEFNSALMEFLVEFYPAVHQKKLSDYLHKKYAKKLKAIERELDPPIQDDIKEKLIHYTGEAIIARAEEYKELLDKTMVIENAGASGSSGKVFLKTASRLSIPVFIGSFILFLFSDFLKPLISLGPFIFISCIGLSSIVYLARIKKYLTSNPMSRILQSTPGEVFVFSVLSIFIWAFITVLSFMSPPRGVMASNFNSVAKWQTQLLKIGTDVQEIKETTSAIQKQTEEIATVVKDIKSAIEALESKSGEIISNPQYPQDFYHNARIFELEGRTQQAIESYEKFIQMEPNFVDVHRSYQILLNNTAGIEKTKRIYQGLQNKYPENAAIQFMTLRLASEEIQKQKLQDLIKQHPNFAPAYAYLGNLIYERGGASSTLTTIKMKNLMDQFKKLDQKGYFKEYYIDKKDIQAVLDDVQRFYNNFEGWGRQKVEKPMVVQVSDLQDGTISIALAPNEAYWGGKKIYYSLGDPNHLKDLGTDPWLKDQNNGKPFPKSSVTIKKPEPGEYIIYSKYADDNGDESPLQETKITMKLHGLTPVVSQSNASFACPRSSFSW